MTKRKKPHALTKSRYIISALDKMNALYGLWKYELVENQMTLHFAGTGYMYEHVYDTGTLSQTIEIYKKIKATAPIDIKLLFGGKPIEDLAEKAERLNTITICFAKLLTTFTRIPDTQLSSMCKFEQLKSSISLKIANLSSSKIQKINSIILEDKKSKVVKSKSLKAGDAGIK